MSDEPRFQKGDLNGVMAAYPHVQSGYVILRCDTVPVPSITVPR